MGGQPTILKLERKISQKKKKKNKKLNRSQNLWDVLE